MSPRLAFLDTVKVLLVVGVIAMHTAITYGLDGSWYLESYDEMAGGVVAAVLLAGVAGSFGLTELARRRVLDHRRHAHPDADAHRRESVTRAAAA